MWNQPCDRLMTSHEALLLSVQCIPLLPATMKNNTRNKCTCPTLLWMIQAECTAVFLTGMRKVCWNSQMCYIKCNFKLFFKLKCILHKAASGYSSKDLNKWDIPLFWVHMLMPSLMKYTMTKSKGRWYHHREKDLRVQHVHDARQQHLAFEKPV